MKIDLYTRIGKKVNYFSFVFVLVLFSKFSFCQCANATLGHNYFASDMNNSGFGTLRQAILDANADNVGGVITVLPAYLYLSSPLPVITCDSLVIYFQGNIISGNNVLYDPPLIMSAPHSCMTGSVLFVDFIGTAYSVTNTNDSGPGSLREAIILCNNSRSSDFISFNIPGAAPHVIQPLTPLPTFLGPVTIDGSTQPANGYSGAAPKIELDGTVCGGTCLRFLTGFSTNIYPHYSAAVYGLFIHNFTYAICNDDLSSSMGLTEFRCGAQGKGNVLSGNTYAGYFSNDSILIIEHNYIGTDTSGMLPFSNSTGIFLNPNTLSTHIIRNNLISGNGIGISIWSGNNFIIKNNLFGTDKTGTFAIPNTTCAINSHGNNVTIGGTNFGDGNLFSGNICSGGTGVINCYNSSNYVIQGNKFGTNLSGTDSIPNQNGPAIYLNDVPGSLIGGSSTNARNIICATGGDAIKLETSYNTVVQNNYIGTDVTATRLFPNSSGVAVVGICSSDSISVIGNIIAGNEYGIVYYYHQCNIGHRILNNIIRDNGDGIFNGQKNVLISHNSIYDNLRGIYNYSYANDSIQPPIINFSTPDSVVGTSLPFATIELYYSQSLNNTPQGKNYIATVIADSSGRWKYTGQINDVLKVTATQTGMNKNTSAFSTLWPQTAPNVWPGDCNYDLTVDNFDFLYLNIANGDTGSIRNNASINWTAQPCTNWNSNFTSGVNHKHADTDGDGIINQSDTIAILQNYGLLHPFRFGQSSILNSSPSFSFVSNADTVGPGSPVTFEIYASDTSGISIDSLYGIAYSILFDAALIDTSQIIIDYSQSVLGTIHGDIESFEKDFYSSGQIDAAICRTNKINQTNFSGLIGKIELKVSNTVSLPSVLHLRPFNLRAITFYENTVDFSLTADSVVIDPAFVGITTIEEEKKIKVFPNPALNFIYITYDLEKNHTTRFILYNSFGQEIRSLRLFGDKKTRSIDISDLENGVYFWTIEKNNFHLLSEKLVILK